jgi:hypothetical protein
MFGSLRDSRTSKGLFVILKSNRRNRKKVLEQRITLKENLKKLL